jgi:hypothetical protein
MASVNGTIPTEGLPGAPTLTVFRVTTDRAGEAIDVPGIASTDAATMASARARRVRRAPSRFGRVSMCSHRRALDILERACHELGGAGCSWLTSSRASRFRQASGVVGPPAGMQIGQVVLECGLAASIAVGGAQVLMRPRGRSAHQVVCLDKKRQRSTWCNVWHSSAIRSTLYTLGAPARAVKGLVERHRAVA